MAGFSFLGRVRGRRTELRRHCLIEIELRRGIPARDGAIACEDNRAHGRGNRTERAAACLLFKNVEVFSGLEADGLAGSDRHLGTRPWISPDTGFPRFDREHAESSQLDAVSFGERLLHGLEDGVDRCLGLGAYEPGPFDDALDEILFDQRGTFQSLLLGCPTGGAWLGPRVPCKAMVETGGLNVNRIAANGNDTLQLG